VLHDWVIMYLEGDVATSIQTVRSLLRTPWPAGKNDLNMGPILLNFIYLETYFLLMNLQCTLGVIKTKNCLSTKGVACLGDNVLRVVQQNLIKH
jgi:hypothetical protein